MQLQQSLQSPQADPSGDTASDRMIDLRDRADRTDRTDRTDRQRHKRDLRIEIDLEKQQRVIVLPEVDPNEAANAPTQIRPGRLLVLPPSEPKLPAFSHFIDARWLQQWRAHRTNLRSVMLNDRPLLEKVISDVALTTRFGTFVELAPFVSATTLDWLQGLSASGAHPTVDLHVSDAAVGYEAHRLTSRIISANALQCHRPWVDESPKWNCDGLPRLISWLGAGIGELDSVNRVAALHRLRSAAASGDLFVLGIDTAQTEAEVLGRYQSVASSFEVLDREHLRVSEGSLTTPTHGTYDISWNHEIDALETHIADRGRLIACSRRFPVGVDQLTQEMHDSGFSVRRVYGSHRDLRHILLAEVN